MDARCRQGLTASFEDLRSNEKDPKGQYIEKPVSKTRFELFALRNRRDHAKIADTTAKGIATSLEARRMQDIEDRQREPEEESEIGREADLAQKACSKRQLLKQRKQREMQENSRKFGRVKLGVHGQDLPSFASS